MSAADHIATVARALANVERLDNAPQCACRTAAATTGGGCPEIEIVWRRTRAAYIATLKAIRDEMYNTDDVDVLDALIAEAEEPRAMTPHEALVEAIARAEFEHLFPHLNWGDYPALNARCARRRTALLRSSRRRNEPR